jgi:hypothetical protein
MKKFLRIFSFLLLVALALFVYFRYFFVFGTGVKAGQLNYVMKKGFVFKTYEGRLIQAGFQGSTAGTIQSYEFRFSVTDDNVANKLMINSGKDFELHYREYMGTLPWRGTSIYIVDSILSMKDTGPGIPLQP